MLNKNDIQYQSRKWRILKQVNVADGLIILGFAIFSVVYFLGRWKGAYPFVFLDGDAANIATFAAGWDHPELFQNDAVLNNQANFRFYATIHIPLLRILAKVLGDYGSAFISLLSPHIFIQALGFYILGRVVFHSRYWAALLAIVTLMPIYINLGEYWGIYIDPQPRFSFQALLPYLLAATFHWGHKPSSWPWLMAGAGALIYVHPVSAPTWGLACWLGLWAFQPTSFSFKKRLSYMLFAGTVFLAVTLPWLIYYLNNRAYGATPKYRQIYEIMASIYGKSYFDIPTALKEFVLIVWNEGLLPLAVVSVALVLWLRRKNYWNVLLIGLWLGGLLLASVAVPLTEHAIASAYNLIPVQIDLIRGIRYIIPILLLLCLWSLVEIGNAFKIQRIAAVIGAVLVFTWSFKHPPIIAFEALSCWRQGQLVCLPAEYSETIAELEAIKQFTPPNSQILPIGMPPLYPLAIRYYALRPVVYILKDANALGYANHDEFIKWYQKYQAVKLVEEEQEPKAKVKELIELSRRLGAQYCITNYTIQSVLNLYSEKIDLIYTNTQSVLLKLNPIKG